MVNRQGEQKGVDSLVVTDMLTLARNRAMAECVLLSGDEDLRVGVQQAQEYGVRVHLLGIKPARGSQSVLLLQEADSTHEWTAENLRSFLDCGQAAGAPATPSKVDSEAVSTGRGAKVDQPPSAVLQSVAKQVVGEVARADVTSLVAHIRATGRRPKELDGRLLARSRTSLGHDLDGSQKAEVRTAFLEALEELMGSGGTQSDDLN